MTLAETTLLEDPDSRRATALTPVREPTRERGGARDVILAQVRDRVGQHAIEIEPALFGKGQDDRRRCDDLAQRGEVEPVVAGQRLAVGNERGHARKAHGGAAVGIDDGREAEALVGELEALPSEPFARPDLTLVTGGAPDPDAWRASRGADRAAGRTLAGPHRDELEFTISGEPARDFASEGQQRPTPTLAPDPPYRHCVDMCFSATASFSVGGATALVGIAALRHVQSWRDVPMAAVPLLLALGVKVAV